jgi:hypothetical protein
MQHGRSVTSPLVKINNYSAVRKGALKIVHNVLFDKISDLEMSSQLLVSVMGKFGVRVTDHGF